MYDLAPIRDTGLNNALKLTDQEIATLSPLRLPVVHKRLDIAYGTAELPALDFDSIQLHEARVAANAPGKLFPSKAPTTSASSANCDVLTARLSTSCDGWWSRNGR